MAAMRVPLCLKIGWTVWVIAWVPFYWTQYGLQNFLFFCDLGNLFLMFALWLESPLIFSWQATGLLLFQTLYAIDLVGAFSTGSHIVGGTESTKSGASISDHSNGSLPVVFVHDSQSFVDISRI